ncbi:MAG: hypothetical protein QG585_639 [Patescibacteria group bacterium]|jgi:hypothetical protein|nr:hypothetical protein [Patescibacteria group bacterium]
MKIKCKKIAKYNTYLKDDLDTFSYLQKLCLGKVNPPTQKPDSIIFDKNSIIFSSPLTRAVQSIKNKENLNLLILPELKEIRFDLEKMCDFKKWKKDKSTIVRKRFKTFFINDTLLDSRKKIFREIRHLLKMVGKYPDKNIIIFSHSFRLKLIEAFVKTDGKIENSPALIRKFIKDNQKTYKFEEEFYLKI